MKKLILALGVWLLAGVGQANANVPAQITQEAYSFIGTCTDCSGTGQATPLLSDYALGSFITAAKLISFTYEGTDLLSPFTVTPGNLVTIDGTINGPLPAVEYFYIRGGGKEFLSLTEGNWCAGTLCASDQGTNGTWSAVPEPASIALVGSSVIGLAAARRRRRQ